MCLKFCCFWFVFYNLVYCCLWAENHEDLSIINLCSKVASMAEYWKAERHLSVRWEVLRYTMLSKYREGNEGSKQKNPKTDAIKECAVPLEPYSTTITCSDGFRRGEGLVQTFNIFHVLLSLLLNVYEQTCKNCSYVLLVPNMSEAALEDCLNSRLVYKPPPSNW